MICRKAQILQVCSINRQQKFFSILFISFYFLPVYYTPVHYAAATGSLEALKILIENGANYNLENDIFYFFFLIKVFLLLIFHKTPLDEAFSRLQRSTYNFLKDLGAEQGTLYKSIPE